MRVCLLVLITCYICGIASAQNSSSAYFIPTVFPKSPNAAGIDKYGDYPVSLFSGLPEISIPLYEITAGEFKVPIRLSYHASGIKVKGKAGWAGLGWSVLAGGQITRMIMGAADEDVNGYFQGKLNPAATVNTGTNDGLQYLNAVKSKNYDAEPDIFSYSFNDKSGKFFFNGQDNYKLIMMPFSPLAVKPVFPSLSAFNILDEVGNKYSFGQTAKEKTSFTRNGFSFYNTSAWLLESMVSQDNRDTVAFSYNADDQVSIPDFTDIWSVEDNVYNYDPSHPAYFSNPKVSIGVNNTSIVLQKNLKQIDFSGGRVVFELSTRLREDLEAGKNALANIKVYAYDYSSNQYKLLKAIRFFTSYFIQGTDVMTKRLRLDSLEISSGSGELLQRYRFDYNNKYMLPGYTSSSIDYWGYYNGKNNNTLIPQMTVPYNLNTITIGSNLPDGRDPDNDYMQACVLKRITYPTGGYSNFEFEANRYVESGRTKLAGGLRIKSIMSTAGYKTKPIVKTYEYLNARPNFTLRNHFFTISQTQRQFMSVSGYLCPLMTGTKTVTSYVSSPTISIEPYDAVPVAYSFVTEYLGDGASNSGRTDYQFTDRSDALQTAALTGTPVINSYFYARGQLLNKTDYLREGGAYKKVREEVNQYVAFPEQLYGSVGFVVGKPIISDESGAGDVSLGPRTGNCATYHDSYSYNYSFYAITSDDNYKVSSTVTDYDLNDAAKSVALTNLYKYDNRVHQQINRVIQTDSKGNTTTDSKKYPADFLVGAATATGNVVIDSMLVHNMQATVIEQATNISGTQGLSGAFTRAASLTNYKQLANTAIKVDKHQTLLTNALLSDFAPAVVNASVLQTDNRYGQLISIDSYDNNSNIQQYTPRNGPTVAILWDYNSKLAIAEVTNAAVNDIAYTSFEADGKGNWTFAGTPVPTAALTGKMSYSLSNGQISLSVINTANEHIVSYWSRSGAANVNSTTAIQGVTANGWTYYEHKIPAGAGTIQISGTAIIDELRLFPQKSQMTTYTYDPSIGVTAICSPLNTIIYYEYDSAGRLKSERDINRNIVRSYDYHHKN